MSVQNNHWTDMSVVCSDNVRWPTVILHSGSLLIDRSTAKEMEQKILYFISVLAPIETVNALHKFTVRK